MFFSYKTRQFLARIFPTLATVLVLLLIAALCWLIWLQRFIVYTPQGAVFDFGLQPPEAAGVIPQQPPKFQVNIEYPEALPDTPLPPITPDTPDDSNDPNLPDPPDAPRQMAITGYYVDTTQMRDDPELLRQQLEQLPAGTAVMLTLGNMWGYRFYPSQYGKLSSSYDMEKMAQLLAWLGESDLYAVARLPAFRDYYYALDNTACGLAVSSGYLWADSSGCYWLNPTDQKVLTRLTQIIRELKDLGFDEVVFDDFSMPDSERVVFDGDRAEAVYAAAETLVTACATEDFAISFVTTDYSFRLPEGNCRLYVENVEPSAVEDVLAQIQTPNDQVHVVFFCGTFDTRFDGCSVLRPLALAV